MTDNSRVEGQCSVKIVLFLFNHHPYFPASFHHRSVVNISFLYIWIFVYSPSTLTWLQYNDSHWKSIQVELCVKVRYGLCIKVVSLRGGSKMWYIFFLEQLQDVHTCSVTRVWLKIPVTSQEVFAESDPTENSECHLIYFYVIYIYIFIWVNIFSQIPNIFGRF